MLVYQSWTALRMTPLDESRTKHCGKHRKQTSNIIRTPSKYGSLEWLHLDSTYYKIVEHVSWYNFFQFLFSLIIMLFFLSSLSKFFPLIIVTGFL